MWWDWAQAHFRLCQDDSGNVLQHSTPAPDCNVFPCVPWDAARKFSGSANAKCEPESSKQTVCFRARAGAWVNGPATAATVAGVQDVLGVGRRAGECLGSRGKSPAFTSRPETRSALPREADFPRWLPTASRAGLHSPMPFTAFAIPERWLFDYFNDVPVT